MNVKKAYEITDAKIKFVSLVDKAANLKQFLITKEKNGEAAFTTYGRIVKADVSNHFVTGIVYEPLTEDAHGNYMTEEEITKAAHYFAKNGGDVDLQHSFEPLDGAAVVESWIAKADFQCGDETVKKGTWLMTMEIDNPKIWGAIEKGDITGFSMGGVGKYSDEDTQLDNISKTAMGAVPEQNEKKGVFKKLAEMLGFDVVEKGALAEVYAEKQKANNFWTAYYALQDMLIHWDSWSGQDVLETDEAKVKEVLADFTSIVESILTSSKPVTKQLAAADEPVVKAGKKISGANKETLQTAYDTLGALLAAVADPKTEEPNPDEGEENKDEEEKDVTKSEVEKIVKDTVAEVIAKGMDMHQPTAEPEQVSGAEVVTKEEVHEIVTKAVSEAIAPLLKARGIPTAINDGSTASEQAVEKHYLHGIL